MAQKIEGAYRSVLGQVEFHEQELPLKNPGAFMPAIIVVGDRNDEVIRVYTESEVIAILRECEKQLETLSIGKVRVGLTGVLYGRSISDPS